MEQQGNAIGEVCRERANEDHHLKSFSRWGNRYIQGAIQLHRNNGETAVTRRKKSTLHPLLRLRKDAEVRCRDSAIISEYIIYIETSITQAIQEQTYAASIVFVGILWFNCFSGMFYRQKRLMRLKKLGSHWHNVKPFTADR